MDKMLKLLFFKVLDLRFVLMSVIVLSILFVTSMVFAVKSIKIEKAEYKSSDNELTVEVKIEEGGGLNHTVVLFDDITGEFLAEKTGNTEKIVFIFSPIPESDVPCRLRAEVGNFTDEKNVENAPFACSGGGGITDNLIALHDSNSPQYDKNCIDCHAEVLNEESLDPETPTAHVSMLLKTPGKKDNDRCAYCHRNVDLLQKSTGNLRRHVDANLCAMCHGPFNPVKQFYASSPINGDVLYDLACSTCHGDLSNSEVGGESASEIQEKIDEDEGGMGPSMFSQVNK